MTVIDTIITCALYMWNVLCWIVSGSWHYSKIVHTFFIAQPSSVQGAIFVGFVLMAWLLFIFGKGFHNRFLAVPENEIWVTTVQITLFAWKAGKAFGTCIIFTGEGFIGFFEGIWLFIIGFAKFIIGVLGFLIIGFAWPFLAFIVVLYALCSIIYGICWATRDRNRIFMKLEPSHHIAFRRAAGLPVLEPVAQQTVLEQAPPRRARPQFGQEFEQLRPSSAWRD
jgi:hypothetical protein